MSDSRNKNESGFFYSQGSGAYKAGKYDEAVSALDKSIELDPCNAWAFYERAHAKDEMSDLIGALEDFTKALELEPKDPWLAAYYSRGNVKYDLGDKEGALDDFTRAIEIDSERETAWLNLGKVKHELGDTQSACEDWKKAAELGDEEAAQLLKEHCE